jgi:hypothetical protein
MAAGQALSIARVTAAIHEHGTLAAAARSLGCSREALSRAVTRWNLRGVLAEAREALCDAAEDGLRLQIATGELGAITYALDTLGKRRGYIRRIQDVAAVANLEALRRIATRLGVVEVDDVALMAAVGEVKAEMDAERA